MKPLVTVIIPSYNHGQYIAEAIESVLKQTYENIELIVVDDGSQDDTHSVLANYESHPKVKLILNNLNRGQSAVIKQGLAVSSGSFVSFLPSDDWYLPNKIALQIRRFKELPEDYGVVYGRGQRYSMESQTLRDVDLPFYEGDILLKLLKYGNFIYPVTPLFRREVLRDELFNDKYMAVGEAIYNVIAISHRVGFVNQVLGVMRDHDVNTGKDPTMRIYRDSVQFWTEFFDRDDLPPAAHSYRQQRIARIHLTRGLSRLVQYQDITVARELLLNALKTDLHSVRDPRWLKGMALCLLPKSQSRRLLSNRYGKPFAPRP